jgi:hypothetical protein
MSESNEASVQSVVVPLPDVFVLIGEPFKWPKMCKRQKSGIWTIYNSDEQTGDWRIWDRVTDQSMRDIVAKSDGIWIKA